MGGEALEAEVRFRPDVQDQWEPDRLNGAALPYPIILERSEGLSSRARSSGGGTPAARIWNDRMLGCESRTMTPAFEMAVAVSGAAAKMDACGYCFSGLAERSASMRSQNFTMRRINPAGIG